MYIVQHVRTSEFLIIFLFQDFNSFAKYVNQFRSAEFLEAVSDLHVLIFMANLDIIPLRLVTHVLIFMTNLDIIPLRLVTHVLIFMANLDIIPLRLVTHVLIFMANLDIIPLKVTILDSLTGTGDLISSYPSFVEWHVLFTCLNLYLIKDEC